MFLVTTHKDISLNCSLLERPLFRGFSLEVTSLAGGMIQSLLMSEINWEKLWNLEVPFFFKFVSCSQAKLFPENPNLTFLESLVEPLAFLLITFISYSFKTIKQLLKNANSLIAQNLVESLAFIFFLNLNVQEWRAGGQTEGGGSPALNWVLTWALL